MKKLNQLIIFNIFMLSSMLSHACESTKYLDDIASIEASQNLFLYIWKDGSTNVFQVGGVNNNTSTRKVEVDRTAVFELCQIEYFLMNIKTPGGSIIVYLIGNPNDADFSLSNRALRPKEEFIDIIPRLENIAEESNLRDFYIMNIHEGFIEKNR